MRARIASTFVLALCSLLAGPAADASSLIPVTLEDLSARAETVVLGTVDRQESRFNDRGTLILTHTTVRVEETIVGDSVSSLTVTEYGGCVGTTCMAIPELPRFVPGERILLFLCRDDLDLPRTCGARQGRLEVITDLDGSDRVVSELAGEPIDAPLRDLRRRILAERGRARR